MTVTIDTQLLRKLGLSPNEYIYLSYLYNQEECLLALAINNNHLVKMGYIKLDTENEGYTLTDQALDALGGVAPTMMLPKKAEVPVRIWIDDYRALFPSGVRSGGYLVKGSKQGCIKKMEKFVRENPQYSKDLILEVTANYIDRKRKANYQHTKLADYFIDKEGVSMLSAECEERLSEKGSKRNDRNEDWGRDV